MSRRLDAFPYISRPNPPLLNSRLQQEVVLLHIHEPAQNVLDDALEPGQLDHLRGVHDPPRELAPDRGPEGVQHPARLAPLQLRLGRVVGVVEGRAGRVFAGVGDGEGPSGEEVGHDVHEEGDAPGDEARAPQGGGQLRHAVRARDVQGLAGEQHGLGGG